MTTDKLISDLDWLAHSAQSSDDPQQRETAIVLYTLSALLERGAVHLLAQYAQSEAIAAMCRMSTEEVKR